MITWSVRALDEVDSTQNLANRLANEGAPEGTVVAAKRQTAGRGRYGRGWVSPEGGLYMSLLLRPPPQARMQTLTLVAALAIVRGVESATGLKPTIRWPNDVMIGGRKVSGAIAESSYHGQTLSYAVVGIGVNCNSKVQSADAGESPATSLAGELGWKIDIASLRQSILEKFGDLYARWLRGADAIETARSKVGTLGKSVIVVKTSGERLEGVAEDIEPAGGLVLKLNGKRLTLRAEDVEQLRET